MTGGAGSLLRMRLRSYRPQTTRLRRPSKLRAPPFPFILPAQLLRIRAEARK